MVENNKATTSALRRTCAKCGREIQSFETCCFKDNRLVCMTCAINDGEVLAECVHLLKKALDEYDRGADMSDTMDTVRVVLDMLHADA